MAKEVTLLGFWASPFVFRVKVALQQKGVVDYEYIEEDIFNKSPRLLELNPVYKKVPVFIHGEKVVNESLIILEYIDETWEQNPLLPRDPYQRAMARFWAKYSEELMAKAFMALVLKGEAKEKNAKEFAEGLEKIEGEFKGKSGLLFAEGESNIGYLELAFGWILYWLPVWEEAGSFQVLDPQKFPVITEWGTKFVNHPLIKENLPARDQMLVYFRKVSEEFFTLFRA
ncbi:hypothetical protein WN944_026020 [Citrus x changshan-huyou]|uniref:Glutathione S-transferase n=1 Tax=Citrus x changshan-huyou TaxID=2935761 RepID=A0AAP0QH82_9ROSI